MATYVNDLRLKEIGTGESSGTWGSETNTNLELIGEALGFGTEGITTNADTHTTTIADGSTDPGRAMYLKYTGTLDSACTITIAPNTISRMQFIENGTSGSQNIIISQGTGANITIPAGDTKAIYLDGAGSGAAVVDAYASLNVVDLKVEDDLTVTDDLIVNGDIDLEGAIDVNGTANLDVVDIDGAVDMASTLTVAGVVDITDTTDSSDATGDTGALRTEGGASIAKKLFVGTDLDVDGTTETDVLTINGSQLNYKTFGTSSFMIGDTTTGTIDAANYNTGVGVDVFAALTSGDLNTAIGFSTLTANTTGFNNSALGNAALQANTTGGQNTALGSRVLPDNTEGNGNVGVGEATLFTNTTGDYNIGIGLGALQNSNSDDNVAIGYRAMHNVSSGTDGVAIGSDALFTVTSGNYNVGIGYHAGRLISTGTQNTALGALALDTNSTGNNNVALGMEALESNTTAANNVAAGKSAMQANTTSAENVGIGYSSLLVQTTQTGNTAVGFEAMKGATTGLGRNVGVGYRANSGITTGAANTSVGWSSGGQTTGNGNTTLGYITNPGTAAAENRIVIGYAYSGTADNRVHLGSNGGHIYNDYTSNATWTQTSDERKKKDIVDDTLGLDFINDLRTTKYKFKARSEFPKEWVTYDAESTTPVDDKVHHGLIAQEVKQALDNAGVDSFEGWDELPDGTQQISREMFVIPLIKAMQELTQQVEILKSEVKTLKGE